MKFLLKKKHKIGVNLMGLNYKNYGESLIKIVIIQKMSNVYSKIMFKKLINILKNVYKILKLQKNN